MMNVNIETIEEDDYEVLIALFKEFAIFEKMPDKMINTVEKMKQEKDLFNGFVVKDETKNILGYVIFYFVYYTWAGKALYMDDLYVRAKYRGQGLGSALINKVIEYAKNNGCSKLRWQVSNWNYEAINFYESIGAEINPVENNCDLVFNG